MQGFPSFGKPLTPQKKERKKKIEVLVFSLISFVISRLCVVIGVLVEYWRDRPQEIRDKFVIHLGIYSSEGGEENGGWGPAGKRVRHGNELLPRFRGVGRSQEELIYMCLNSGLY